MSTATTVSLVIHLVFAGLWTGSVLFVAMGVLPLAGRDGVGPAAVAGITTRLTTVSRLSAVILLLTGGHLAGAQYTVADLTGSTAGYAVLAMVGLWLVLAVLVEVAASRINSETGHRLMTAAAVVAALLLLDAGLLTAGL
ncbi:MAG: transporter [Halodesulfurarchaeum sp.]